MLSKCGNSKYGMVCLLKIKKPGPSAKLNKKKYYVMLNGHGNENSKKNSVSLISKKNRLCTCSTQSWFLYISLLLICKTTTWNLIVARFIMEEMSYVLTKNFVACFLVHCCSFSPCWPLAFLIFLTVDRNFSCCFSNELPILCFSSLALSVALSLLSTSV